MGIMSWKKEFYSPITKTNQSTAAEHALKKWIGLRKENLERHGLFADIRGHLQDANTYDVMFNVDMTTCALCRAYPLDDCTNGNGSKCPISNFRSLPADEFNCYCNVEYLNWRDYADPEPMIALLQQVVESQENADK